jgi:membrane associated rhomboid family serine protease
MRYRSQNFGTPAVWVLIAANIIIFIATIFTHQAIDLLALQRTGLTSHPWTLVTALFVHGSITHILFNMLWLYWYGTALLHLIGEGKFLALYFAGGLIGNILFVLIEPLYPAIGASGAVLALGGALAVMRPKLKIVLFPIPIPMDLWIYVLFGSVFLGILIPFASRDSNIAWQAHLGGLVTGLIAGYIFRMRERRRSWR